MKQRSTDAAAVMAADEPMAITLSIVTGLLTIDRMRASIEAGFGKSTRGNTAPIRDQIDALIDALDEDVEKGDRFELVYLPGRGLTVYRNGVHRAKIESGLRFKQALFGIWISDQPVQLRLKEAMLDR